MKDEEFIRIIRFYIIRNLSDKDLCAEDLVQVGLTSRANLYRKIRRLTDLSVNGYIQQIRLLEAQRLLRENRRYSIGQIAEKVGFNDQSYFSKQFKKEFHYSPIQYRQQLSKGSR